MSDTLDARPPFGAADDSCCGQTGVICDVQNNVIELELSGRRLRGVFPTNFLVALTHLERFSIANNPDLTGQVPNFWRSGSLDIVDFSNTGLSGSVPLDALTGNRPEICRIDRLCADFNHFSRVNVSHFVVCYDFAGGAVAIANDAAACGVHDDGLQDAARVDIAYEPDHSDAHRCTAVFIASSTNDAITTSALDTSLTEIHVSPSFSVSPDNTFESGEREQSDDKDDGRGDVEEFGDVDSFEVSVFYTDPSRYIRANGGNPIFKVVRPFAPSAYDEIALAADDEVVLIGTFRDGWANAEA
nr:hypothetical protein HK105_002592 [Polyrhizophydium stewartii]